MTTLDFRRRAAAPRSRLGVLDVVGRGLHSSTFLLNLSRFRHKMTPKHPLICPDTSSTPLNNHYTDPLPTESDYVELKNGRV